MRCEIKVFAVTFNIRMFIDHFHVTCDIEGGKIELIFYFPHDRRTFHYIAHIFITYALRTFLIPINDLFLRPTNAHLHPSAYRNTSVLYSRTRITSDIPGLSKVKRRSFVVVCFTRLGARGEEEENDDKRAKHDYWHNSRKKQKIHKCA